MQEPSNHDPEEIDVWAEHLVVLAVVGVTRARPRERIYRTLRDVDTRRLDRAIDRLCRAGVVELRGETVRQTAALARLDRLDMICI